MELRHLRYFVAVAEELNFSKAALRLFTSQPSLSQQIKDLEDEIGVQLFERTKRRVDLTPEGEVFLREARLTLEQAERAIQLTRQAHQNRSRLLSVGFVPAAEVSVFPFIFPKLRAAFPNLDVTLHSLPTGQQEQALLNGEIDIAFMRQIIQNDDYEHTVVLKEPLALLLPHQHPLAAKANIDVQDLNHVDFVHSDPAYSGLLYPLINQYFQDHNIRVNTVQNASNILLNLNLVGMGLGCTLLPAYTTAIISDRICVRPLNPPPPPIDLLMVTRKDHNMPELKAFKALVNQQFA
ncbi:MAG: DNA-binding transcriptional regulator HcaR [Neisseriaceae bacterium]|nr:DNA-binding transcriptional regulator HcaR [Neisseriaceae bacterium]MBP6862729.1 DNA-binding transcriptional regulator HcaR [Neisseriaceae bacterium]